MTIDIDAPIDRVMRPVFDTRIFGTRIRNTLKYEKITTVRQLMEKSRGELRREPNWGPKTVRVLEDWLTEHGLALWTSDRLPPPSGETVHELIDKVRALEARIEVREPIALHARVARLEALAANWSVSDLAARVRKLERLVNREFSKPELGVPFLYVWNADGSKA